MLKVLTKKEESQFRQLYRSHVSLNDIGSIMGIAWRRVKREIARLGLNRRQAVLSKVPSKKLLGRRFNWLTIVGFDHHDFDNQWWMEIKCDCGNRSQEILRKLKLGRRKTCGITGCKYFHSIRALNGRKANFTGHKEIYGSRWAAWRIGAEKRDLQFTVTPQYAWRIYLKQKRRCALTGVEIDFGNSYSKLLSASLDRKDSTKGYIKGNIQWVHKIVNLMKRSMSDEEFIEWGRRVARYASK